MSRSYAEIEAPAEAGRESHEPSRARQARQPLRAWLDDLDAEQKERDTAGLPLFDWAENGPGKEGRPQGGYG
jgi:hypothetical protein